MYNESEFLIVNFDSHCSLDVLLDSSLTFQSSIAM